MPDNLPNPDASAVISPSSQIQQGRAAMAPQGPEPAAPINLPEDRVMPTTQATAGMGMSTQQPNVQQAPAPSGWHKALQSLMGSSTQYQQTPNGPVPVQVPNKPGQLFRSILAGAIMGGAAGEEAHQQNPYGGFAGGLTPGAKAGIQNQQAKQQRAQQH